MKKIPNHANKVFSGILYDVYHWDQKMFDGTTQSFELMHKFDTVGVISITKQKTLLINYEQQPVKGSFHSLPAGGVEKGESILEAAYRELKEETGYTTQDLQCIHTFDVYSKVESYSHLIIARGCEKTHDQSCDPGEKIVTSEVTFDEWIDIIASNTFTFLPFKSFILSHHYHGTLESFRDSLLQ